MNIRQHRDGDSTLLAISFHYERPEPGLHFVTDPEGLLQAAYMCHPAGHRIAAHYHQPVDRQLSTTWEVVLVKRGHCKVTLDCGEVQLGPGDFIVLISGAHSFVMETDCEMYEVKQGPYAGEADKRRL